MERERLETKKKEAEDYLNNLLQEKEKVANGIQQLVGRIQTYNEWLEELKSDEVATTEDAPADSNA